MTTSEPVTINLGEPAKRVILLSILGFSAKEIGQITRQRASSVTQARAQAGRAAPFGGLAMGVIDFIGQGQLTLEAVPAFTAEFRDRVLPRLEALNMAVQRLINDPPPRDQLLVLAELSRHYAVLSPPIPQGRHTTGPLRSLQVQTSLDTAIGIIAAAAFAGVLTVKYVVENAPEEHTLNFRGVGGTGGANNTPPLTAPVTRASLATTANPFLMPKRRPSQLAPGDPQRHRRRG